MYGDERGRIFLCQLEPATTAGRRPDVKYGHECLFSRNTGEAHIGATLVCMGRVEQILPGGVHRHLLREARGDYMFKQERPYFRYMFRVTKFIFSGV